MTALTWQDPQHATPPADLQAQLGGHPLVAQLLYSRGIKTLDAAQAFMYPAHYTPRPANELPDMEKAVERVQRAINKGEQVAVWGDFDVDGQTATALLVSALRALGANVTSYIPLRRGEGHGVHVTSLGRLIDEGAKLVLTCDTGVDAHEAVDYANSRGVDVVITDHHKLPDTLPNAFAVVNSRRVPLEHPLRHLPGVGVAYKLIEALAPPHYDPTPLLDLVALGIVADVAVQQGDTRYLLQRGMDVLRDTTRLGLLEIMRVGRIVPSTMTETDIAFGIAPRMNALGRLSDANASTELLTTDSLKTARELAERLDGLNSERKRLTDEVWHGVQQMLKGQPHLLKYNALVLSHPSWHTGVVGIVANQCVERYGKPTLLLASPPGDVSRGSARSVDGVDITDAIAENAGLLLGYGGHTMAAGLALRTADIAAFRQALSDSVLSQRKDNPHEAVLPLDAWLPMGDLTLELVHDLQRVAPFGAGNPRPIIGVRDVLVVGKESLGKTGKHLRLRVENRAGEQLPVYWWKADEPPTGRFDLAVTLHENVFRGERKLQPEWVDARPIADAAPVEGRKKRPFAVADYRQRRDEALEQLRMIEVEEGEALAVWGEALPENAVGAVNRLSLTTVPTLAVWSVPPSSAVWEAILEAVGPEMVYLFGAHVTDDGPEAFLLRLMGLARYAVGHKDGAATLAQLAAATNQREATVRAGLDWLATSGEIGLAVSETATAHITMGDDVRATGDKQAAMRRMMALLRETNAYRAHWQRTAAKNL